MLSSVSMLLLCLMIYCFVVYRNGIGVMNIQFAEDGVGAGARERKDTWSRGSREGVGAGGPNSEDAVGAGARTRKMQSEPGPELGRCSRSRGPRKEGCSKEYEHEEEEGLKRT